MDASSIITQVSRDDELGAFNNEKGAYRVNRPAPFPLALSQPLPPVPARERSALRQMLRRDFVPLHLLRRPHPRRFLSSFYAAQLDPPPLLPRSFREQLLACPPPRCLFPPPPTLDSTSVIYIAVPFKPLSLCVARVSSPRCHKFPRFSFAMSVPFNLSRSAP